MESQLPPFTEARNQTPLSPLATRTIMEPELMAVLGSDYATAGPTAIYRVIVEDNLLGKPSRKARQVVARLLRAYYSLDPQSPAYRALLVSALAVPEAAPLLVLSMAAWHDGTLIEATPVLLAWPLGETCPSIRFLPVVEATLPTLRSQESRKAACERIVASYGQSGHLAAPTGGRGAKVRTTPVVRPVNVAYALLLGHLDGITGNALFETNSVHLLDRPAHVIRELAAEAAREGWIELRQAGGVTQVTFDRLLAWETLERVAGPAGRSS